MTGWHTGSMCGFDTETTGVDPTAARIVTAAVLHIVPGQEIRRRVWLVNPGIDIPAAATEVHGITTDHAREHGTPADVAIPEIAQELARTWQDGIPVVAFNAVYDLTVLVHELDRHGLPPLDTFGPVAPVIDPLVLDRRVDRYRKGKRTLTACCEVYGVRLEDAHAADGDALSAARVAWAIANRNSEVADLPLQQLHDLQAEWHAAWAAEFEQYLTRQGKPERIERDWPVRPLVERAAVLS